MKIKIFGILTLLSLISSTHLLSADWVNKEILISSPIATSYSQILIDDEGNSTAYWQTRNRLFGATLGSTATKWQLTNDFSGHPKFGFAFGQSSGIDIAPTTIAISKEGTVASLWAEFPKSPLKALIRASLLTQGSQVWEIPKTINTISNTDYSVEAAGALTFDSQSRLHAAWNDGTSTFNKIQTAYLDVGAAKWSNPVTISSGATAKSSSYRPVFANNPLQDRIVVVWRAVFGDGLEQVYSSYLLANSTTWSAPKALSKLSNGDLINYYSIEQVNITPNKNHAVISWVESITKNKISSCVIRYAILDSSNKWIVNQLLDSAFNGDSVSLAIDPELTTTFVYDKGPANSISKVYSKTLSATNKLSSIQAISSNKSQLPNVVVDASGKATAIWQEAEPGEEYTKIFSSARFKSGKWSKPVQIFSVKKDFYLSGYPDLAINAVGTTVAIWSDNNFAFTRHNLSSAIQLGELPLAPTRIKGKQERDKLLLQQGAFYNKISWQKSPSKHVLSYDIYRDGKYLASIDAKDNLVYVDAKINVGLTYLYSVKAVNKTGVSYPVKVSVNPK